MKTNCGKPIDRKQNTEGARRVQESRGCESEWRCRPKEIGLWGNLEISRHVLSAEIRIALWLNVLLGQTKPRDGPITRRHTQRKEKKKEITKWRNCKGESVRFTSPETIENELENDAIPESQVNVATRKVNIDDFLGGSDWGNKDFPAECSRIIDTGFNGGWLFVYSWLRKYIEYLGSFQNMATISKQKQSS